MFNLSFGETGSCDDKGINACNRLLYDSILLFISFLLWFNGYGLGW